MPTKKVTDLAADTTVKDTDTYHVVDTTDTTQGPAGSSYKITWLTLRTAIAALYNAAISAAITAERAAVATLTNKTLTSPLISSPVLTIGSDATGDLYYRSSGGFTRLAIGAATNILTVIGGLPAWSTPPQTPSGTIAMFGGSSAPTNWLLCDGSAVSRTTYAALFAIISTAYGVGDGSTTFNVPDMRGRVAVGKNGATFNTLGGTGGEETHLLTSAESGVPAHNHPLEYGTTGGTGTGPNGIASTNTGPFQDVGGVMRAKVNTAANASSAHNNLQPYNTVNFIIAI